jgi:hypothetical protein
MCAWHDADADLPGANRKQNARRYRTEGQCRQGKGRFQKWAVRRKHEAECMYIANSEPTIWQRGGG